MRNMLEELDVVRIINSPVNYPNYWNKTGTIIYSHGMGYYLIEFEDNNTETLNIQYLELVWSSDNEPK